MDLSSWHQWSIGELVGIGRRVAHRDKEIIRRRNSDRSIPMRNVSYCPWEHVGQRLLWLWCLMSFRHHVAWREALLLPARLVVLRAFLDWGDMLTCGMKMVARNYQRHGYIHLLFSDDWVVLIKMSIPKILVRTLLQKYGPSNTDISSLHSTRSSLWRHFNCGRCGIRVFMLRYTSTDVAFSWEREVVICLDFGS